MQAAARNRKVTDARLAPAQSRAAALMSRAGSGSSVDTTTAALFAEARVRYLADRAASAETAVRAAASSASSGGVSAASTPRVSNLNSNCNPSPDAHAKPGHARARLGEPPSLPSPFELEDVKAPPAEAAAGADKARLCRCRVGSVPCILWSSRLIMQHYEHQHKLS